MASRHDFDPLFGTWIVRHRKLADVADPECREWVEFTSMSVVSPVLGGVGHLDRLFVPEPADHGAPFEAFTLRLHEPEADLWRIWWSTSRVPGVLDTPVEGRFDGPHGTFETDDVVAERPLRMRFTWDLSDVREPRWEQRFTWDGGTTWHLNWIMRLTPVV